MNVETAAVAFPVWGGSTAPQPGCEAGFQSMSEAPFVELREVSLAFDEKQVLSNVSFRVATVKRSFFWESRVQGNPSFSS